MHIIKKLFHLFWALIFSLFFAVLLGLLYHKFFLHVYHIDILLPKTYHFISQYWNSGATLNGSDLIMLFALFSYVPICLIAFLLICRFRFIKLISVPLNWLGDLGFTDYKIPNVNIKNLKIEDKKTLEQFIQERLEKEKNKSPQTNTNAFRKEIVEEIEKRKNN